MNNRCRISIKRQGCFPGRGSSAPHPLPEEEGAQGTGGILRAAKEMQFCSTAFPAVNNSSLMQQ